MVTIVNKCVAVRMERRAASTMGAVTVRQDIQVLRVLRVGIHVILVKVLTPTHFINLILVQNTVMIRLSGHVCSQPIFPNY